MSIKDNLDIIEKNIKEALIKSKRENSKVEVIAVTKTVDVDRINEALDLGLNNIGENRPQELVKKYDIIGNRANFHMIGHLQTNKVKYIIDKVSLIHSLDRLSLAEELQKRAEKLDILVNALVQVNVADEKSKFGLKIEEVIPFINKVMEFDNLRIKGLMTIAPFVEDPEDIRWVFRDLRKLSENIARMNLKNVEMKYLSMGMTNDYQVAIEEGANMIRIGTGLFGKRN
ncbi:MAG: YggS family pyridoxal phosphate-dependent enzyme [Tissierellia bacterium]|nr:YggS family pyridoxal phosphate-dependent enzyme [Tissierellia bacterium]